MNDIAKLADVLRKSKKTVFFGGAGVSTESNIPDFRSDKGLYSRTHYGFPPEEILSHTFFMRNPEIFYKFYFDKVVHPGALPNDAHKALAELEAHGYLSSVITQNIDGLHQVAGSKRVIELHGSILRNKCTCCGKSYNLGYMSKNKNIVPKCDTCGAIIKPDVVLYHESLNAEDINNAVREIQTADTLIIGGTSLAVYPAAGMIRYFGGDNLVLINKTATSHDRDADIIFRDSIGTVLREAANLALNGNIRI